jgi:hypothetical protein
MKKKVTALITAGLSKGSNKCELLKAKVYGMFNNFLLSMSDLCVGRINRIAS